MGKNQLFKCIKNGSSLSIERNLDGLVSNKSHSLTFFFHIRKFPKQVPWVSADLKIGDLAVGTEDYSSKWHAGKRELAYWDITKSQHILTNSYSENVPNMYEKDQIL